MGRGGAAARLFAAAELPSRARHELGAWGRGLLATLRGPGDLSAPRAGALRVLDPDVMHLTLCFLGSRPVAEIDALIDELEGFEAVACELALGAPIWLPRRRPRALAVEVADPSGTLARVQSRLAHALARASGWEPERRRFRPHVTVARVRGRGGLGEGHVLALEPTPALAFSARSLSLYRSRLAPAGASYELLASVALADA